MNLASNIEQAANVLKQFTSEDEPKDKIIPLKVLKDAKGIAFLSVVKAGFLWSGSLGSGILIKKNNDGKWGNPVSLGTAGVGFGFQIGAQRMDVLITLYDETAVDCFASTGQLKFGMDVGLSLGPLGRDVGAEARLGSGGFTGSFYYIHAQGLFAGMSLEGAALIQRNQDNCMFYKQDRVVVSDILEGKIEMPPENERAVTAYANLCEQLDLVISGELLPKPEPEAIPSTLTVETSCKTSMIRVPTGSVKAPPAIKPAGSKKLPDGWVAVTTDEGEVYYHNANTDETSWEFPTEETTATTTTSNASKPEIDAADAPKAEEAAPTEE